MASVHDLTADIRSEALRLGFSECGFSAVRHLEEVEDTYANWISNNQHAGMEYMERNRDKRLDPSLLVENAQTVISLLFNYYTAETLTGSPLKIARYAYGDDYHDVLKARLYQLDRFIRDHSDQELSQRCFVDSAPVMERAWAQESGLGWIGKNSCLISRKHGSFVFIAEIITSLPLETDVPLKDYCGSCRKCVDACPTQAITEYRTINSQTCISYQTIENKTDIPQTLHGKFQHYIFGCDICQEACPWNKKAHPHAEPLFFLRKSTQSLTQADWQTMDENTYAKLFKGSPIKRSKFFGLKRNIIFVSNASEEV